MRFILAFVVLATFCTVTLTQRPFYAGRRPIGYPELAARFDPEETNDTNSLNNRFGEGGQASSTGPTVSTTTVRLPVDALGDRELVDRISKWPRDKWPFWYANWRAIEEHRQRPVSNTITTNTRSSFQRNPQ